MRSDQVAPRLPVIDDGQHTGDILEDWVLVQSSSEGRELQAPALRNKKVPLGARSTALLSQGCRQNQRAFG